MPLSLQWSQVTIFLVDINKKKKFRKLENYPCHTKSVEQGVKLVTEASALVRGVEARD